MQTKRIYYAPLQKPKNTYQKHAKWPLRLNSLIFQNMMRKTNKKRNKKDHLKHMQTAINNTTVATVADQTATTKTAISADSNADYYATTEDNNYFLMPNFNCAIFIDDDNECIFMYDICGGEVLAHTEGKLKEVCKEMAKEIANNSNINLLDYGVEIIEDKYQLELYENASNAYL